MTDTLIVQWWTKWNEIVSISDHKGNRADVRMHFGQQHDSDLADVSGQKACTVTVGDLKHLRAEALAQPRSVPLANALAQMAVFGQELLPEPHPGSIPQLCQPRQRGHG